MTFGEKLRHLRQEKGMTLRTLAEATGLSFTYLSKIETGKVPYTPSVDKIRALAEALGVRLPGPAPGGGKGSPGARRSDRDTPGPAVHRACPRDRLPG